MRLYKYIHDVNPFRFIVVYNLLEASKQSQPRAEELVATLKKRTNFK